MKNFVIITLHVIEQEALNIYVSLDSYDLECLNKKIDEHLFKKRNLQKLELRKYWLNKNKNKIYILNQVDYDMFWKESQTNHLHLEPAEFHQATAEPTFEHDGIFCAACAEQYKKGYYFVCHQCPELYLCCEQAKKHKLQSHCVERCDGRLPISQAAKMMVSEREVNEKLSNNLSELTLGGTPINESLEDKENALNQENVGSNIFANGIGSTSSGFGM